MIFTIHVYAKRELPISSWFNLKPKITSSKHRGTGEDITTQTQCS